MFHTLIVSTHVICSCFYLPCEHRGRDEQFFLLKCIYYK